MRITSFLLFATAAAITARPALGAAEFRPEIGVSTFDFRQTQLESGSTVFSVDEPSKVAPYLAATIGFTERFGLRFSYHYLDDVETVAEFGSPPGSLLPIVVWGHYRDDVHLVSAAPEFTWKLGAKLTLAVAPQLNWASSRGTISYSTTNPLVLLVAPRPRNDDGFTLGAAVRAAWPLGTRGAVSLGYQYVDLEPSFGRAAHVFSGGVQWKF